jgi:hypothetical protein
VVAVLGNASSKSFDRSPDIFPPKQDYVGDERTDLPVRYFQPKNSIQLTAALPTVNDQAYDPVKRGRPTVSNAFLSKIPFTKTVEALYRPPSAVRRFDAMNGKALDPHRLL